MITEGMLEQIYLNPEEICGIKSDSDIAYIISRFPEVIKFVPYPTEEQQISCIKANCDMLEYIRNPCFKALRLAFSLKGELIQLFDYTNSNYPLDNLFDLAHAAVSDNGHAIQAVISKWEDILTNPDKYCSTKEIVNNRFEDLCDTAIYTHPMSIRHLKNPTDRQCFNAAISDISALQIIRNKGFYRKFFNGLSDEGFTTDDYIKSLSACPTYSMFTLAYQWQDKPHRHLYGLCEWVNFLNNILSSRNEFPVYYSNDGYTVEEYKSSYEDFSPLNLRWRFNKKGLIKELCLWVDSLITLIDKSFELEV